MKYVRLLQELKREDLSLAGGKGANLGELVLAGMKVPQGFVLTVEGYRHCIPKIRLPKINVEDLPALEAVTSKIQMEIENVSLPREVTLEVLETYRRMGSPTVAVRSSATAEDLPGASFAGQQETYLNIQGERAVLEAIKKCWASLWSSRAVQYRLLQGFGESEAALAVVIQEMAPHEVSGVVFTVNPLTNNSSELIINAVHGIGESLVQGEIIPDQWIARRPDGAILKFVPAPKKGQSPFPLRTQRPARGCLTSQQVREVVCLCLQIEKHFDGVPQDIEWSYGLGEFYLLQSRPITTLKD
ncbi:phosphoenolpyruvate synthase/pyruvate phosphate dikinase [Desulfosporosinus acidiphilus SJ4]|uniref:Phosphoenolpyruvate synthase n=1 Tax=Desulfosporosinus acidiphilus (strain DSM 22704 / JCM 16185 / SJ4) TaxID=646529 RepID=I4D5K4_DESAJ|nr:PEP/pyruvate-binding domain-containing protein [Desulfosporosinus acidiphilus]AFM41078.1 phosphoenolpyruvate synthase/pyruvate phosphate dikinase [Desulfosporosinus acidiphilus SJ4]